MDNSVVIKGNRHGLVVVLDKDVEFEKLKELTARKFSDSSKFLGNCKTAVSFDGRELTQAQELELLDVIKNNSELEVVCLLSNDAESNRAFEKAVNDKLMDYSGNTARFFKGNLRSGQNLEMENSIIIVGDVNPGATVISNGNIVVLGSLKGNAYAGASGNASAFVLAFDMNPMQIRIADVIAKSPDKPEKNPVKENKIAFLENGCIYIEPATRNILSALTIN